MITVKFRLYPTTEQTALLSRSAKEYIKSVNDLTAYMDSQTVMSKLSTASFDAALPSAVKNEALNTAKSVFKKYKKDKQKKPDKGMPVLKKPIISWNNQNYEVKDETIECPLWINGKSQRTAIKFNMNDYQSQRLAGRLGNLRITRKNNKWTAQIAVEPPVTESTGDCVMGVDLGLKIPAVAVTGDGKTKFFGNGRQNKYMKRKFRSKRKALGKAKKQKAINSLSNKEQRWMKDKDHKVSRRIVNFAKNNDISVIRMEQLKNIRNTAKTSRKNAKNLHTWSFYRLSKFIEYKAGLEGIRVEYVNPKYTSQTCPHCGERNHANDRKYKCRLCGYRAHRDRVGAINIISAPMVSGKRKPA